jgi:hypothetical protein
VSSGKLGSIVSRLATSRRESKPFVHVLATRIGIGVYDEAWFDYRLALFESITIPSMRAQTCQDFTWQLVVDRQMPAGPRARLDRAIGGIPNVVVEPVEFKTNLKASVAACARRLAAERGVPLVMTSRLDDDDAMRVDAFERLHQEALAFTRVSSLDYAVFSFNLGCTWLPSRRLGYTRYHDSHSLALSFVEPAAHCRSIYSRPHRKIKLRVAPRGAYFACIDGDRPWWLYAVHNLADSDTGDERRADRILNHRYGYRLDNAMLAAFGLYAGTIDRLAELSDPRARKPTLRMWLGAMDLEREIRELRSRLAEAQPGELAELTTRIEELEQRRRALGSGIVER